MPPGREPNWQLAAWMELYGYSSVDLARAVTDRARQRGVNAAPDARRVCAWRQGERPREPVAQLIADLFSEDAGRSLTPVHLGLAPGGVGAVLTSPWAPQVTIQAMSLLSRSDLMLNAIHDLPDELLTGQSLYRAVQPWLTDTGHCLHRDDLPRRIGMSDIERINAVTEDLRRIDNRSGGGLAREAVAGQLATVSRLLDESSYTEEVGRALFRCAGDLATMAGWTAHDVGLHTTAQRYLLVAVRAANEAGDRCLGAHALNCLARQANHLGRPGDALELVRLALYGVGDVGDEATPTTTAMLHALEARCYAAVGKLREHDRAAGHARDDFAHSNPTEDPPWVAFFDTAECIATLGASYHLAAAHRPGQAATAIQLINEAIRLRSDHRSRSRVFDHIILARAYLAGGQLDAAAAAMNTALDMAPNVSSRRIQDRLVELGAEARQCADTELREPLERLTSAR